LDYGYWIIEIAEEAQRADTLHPPMHSLHEGYALILEELDELWEKVKAAKNIDDRPLGLTEEATQVGAMALRFLSEFGGQDR